MAIRFYDLCEEIVEQITSDLVEETLKNNKKLSSQEFILEIHQSFSELIGDLQNYFAESLDLTAHFNDYESAWDDLTGNKEDECLQK